MQSRTTGGARAFLHRLSGHNDDAAAGAAGAFSGAAVSPSAAASSSALPVMPEENEAAGGGSPSLSSSAFADRAERPSKRDKYNKARSDSHTRSSDLHLHAVWFIRDVGFRRLVFF